MKKIIISIALIFTILFVISDMGFPWDVPNHEKMSKKAVSISQLPDYCEDYLDFPFLSKKFQGPTHSKYKWSFEEFASDQNFTATDWIKHGSGAEDEFFKWYYHFPHYGKNIRSINHFYNPFWDNNTIYPYGNEWSFQEGGLYDDIASGVAGVELYVGKPLPRWGYNGCKDSDGNNESPPNSYFTRSDNNYFSWIMARKYFYAALSGDSTEIDGIGGVEGKTNMNENERDRCLALLFRSLGQLLHLVQDAGQPEHTRNDAHPLSGFWGGFEHYATKYNCTSQSCSSVIPWQSIVKSENSISDFIDSNRSGGGYDPAASTGIAEFSNHNFLTKDSIADNIIGAEPHGHERHRYFISPRINEDLFALEEGFRYDTYYYLSGPISDPFGIYPGNEYKLAKRRWYHNLLVMYGWRDYTTEDPKVWDAYLDILIPRCIGYSAALLNYFFRGKLEVEAMDGSMKITNNSEEAMHDGLFELYYDNAEGERQQIEIYSGAEVFEEYPLEPDDDQTITFDLPVGAASYILVYKGGLGNETDAVVGRVIEPPILFYLRLKIDGNDLFYGGQQFQLKYTNMDGDECILGPKRMHGDVERDDKGYTMGVIGPLEFDKPDLTKPFYIGLKADRYILPFMTTLTDPAETPFDDVSIMSDVGCYSGHFYYPDQYPSHVFYRGLGRMFSYIIKDNEEGSFRTYAQDVDDDPIEHSAYIPEQCGDEWTGKVHSTLRHFRRGITLNDSIAGGTVSPDKYKYLDVLYKQVSWSDFLAYHKEDHITEASYPDAEEIEVVDFDLLYALKVHYTGASYFRSCPCHDIAGLFNEDFTNCRPPSEAWVGAWLANTFGFSKGTFDKQDAFVGGDVTYHCWPYDSYTTPCGSTICCLYDYPSSYITNYNSPSGQAYMKVDDELGSNFSERSISGGYSWDYWLVLMACTDFDEIVSCITASSSESWAGSSEPTPIYWF